MWKPELQRPKPIAVDIDDNDPEIKTEIKINTLMIEAWVLKKLETSISSWIKLVKVVAWIIKMKKILLTRIIRERSRVACTEHQ